MRLILVSFFDPSISPFPALVEQQQVYSNKQNNKYNKLGLKLHIYNSQTLCWFNVHKA